MKRETYEYYTAKILKQLMMGYGETMQDNPAVGFTKRVKAGVYDHLSDEDYEDTLSFYEDASAFWNKRPQATPEQLISNILQKAQPSEAIRNKMAALIADSYAQSVGDFKKTKKSEREIDIRPLIYKMVVEENGKIFMQVAAGSATNLKPELVMQTLCRLENLEENDYAWLVTRCDMYADKGNEQTGRQLVSLEDFAE